VFDYTYILLFNLAFTSLPIIFMGILDQDVNDKVSIAVPQLYRRGIERLEWTNTKFWIYMVDGLYQSVICFYFAYLVFEPANTVTGDGRDINDYKRFGVYVATPAVVVVNTYIMLNTYRWDWFMSLVASISTLLIFFWTGVYSSFTGSFTFYGTGAQVLGALSFWASIFLTIVLCLLPRFAAKAVQKVYFPRDVDIIREQIRQGKFDYLKDVDPLKVSSSADKVKAESTSSSEISKSADLQHKRNGAHGHNNTMSDDMRPIYPPSVAPTATTHNPRSHNGSDGTDYTGHRSSFDRIDGAFPPAPPGTSTQLSPGVTERFHTPRESMDRPRPSFDRLRSSMDRTRPSFEQSRDFTSAAYLARVESSQSAGGGRNHAREQSRTRMNDLSDDLR